MSVAEAHHGLELPAQLRALIALGAWPARVDDACVKAFAPSEDTLHLYDAKDFHTIANELRAGRGMTPAQWGAHDIDPERTLIIADFGIGADAALALDYRHADEPSVIRLVWTKRGAPNRWVEVAPTFDDFWAMVRLRARPDER